MRLLFLILLAQLAVLFSNSLPISSNLLVHHTDGTRGDSNNILYRRGLFRGWLKSSKPVQTKPTTSSPVPSNPPQYAPQAVATQPHPPQASSPQPAPLSPLSNSFMTTTQKHSRLASANAINAGKEIGLGAKGSVQTIRYGAQQSYLHSGEAVRHFRQGNMGKGFVQLRNAAGKGVGGVVYAPVPLAKGLQRGTISGARAINYKVKQWAAPRDKPTASNPIDVNRQAAQLRQDPQGYAWSNRFIQNKLAFRPKGGPPPPYYTSKVPVGQPQAQMPGPTPGPMPVPASRPVPPPIVVPPPSPPMSPTGGAGPTSPAPVSGSSPPMSPTSGAASAPPAATVEDYKFELPAYRHPPTRGRPLSSIPEGVVVDEWKGNGIPQANILD